MEAIWASPRTIEKTIIILWWLEVAWDQAWAYPSGALHKSSVQHSMSTSWNNKIWEKSCVKWFIDRPVSIHCPVVPSKTAKRFPGSEWSQGRYLVWRLFRWRTLEWHNGCRSPQHPAYPSLSQWELFENVEVRFYGSLQWHLLPVIARTCHVRLRVTVIAFETRYEIKICHEHHKDHH